MKEKNREFEKRYIIFLLKKKDIKIEQNLSHQYARNLEQLRRVKNRVSLISYYEEILSTSKRIKEIENLTEQKKKIIGTFCNFVPEELIYACDCIPVRLCSGSYDTISVAEEILPRDICPLIKSSLGFKMLGLSYFELCDLVIIPTTCDGKKKLGEILNYFLPVWMLEVPHRKSNLRAKDFWREEIKRLKNKLEEFSKVKITPERLKQSIQKLRKRQAVFRQFYQLRKHNPPLINGRDSLLVVQASFYDDIERWTQKTEELCSQLKHLVSHIHNSASSIRLLLTGAPLIWPNYKLINIIEELGATVVIDDLCSGTQHLYESVEVDEWTQEGMLRAIANRYLLPSICPCFVESDDRMDRILNLIDEFKVEGVIYHSLRLCQLYDMESYKLRQVLKDKNIPLLNIHTDYSQEDTEQIKTRLEAFLEMIKARMVKW